MNESYRVLSLAFSVVLLAVGLIIYRRVITGLPFPVRGAHQVTISALAAVGCAGVVHGIRAEPVRWAAFTIEVVFLLLASFLSETFVWGRLFWFIPLVFQLGVFATPTVLLAIALPLEAVMLCSNRLVTAWGVQVPPAPAREIVVIALFGLAVIALVTSLRFLIDRFGEQELLVNNLKMNIVKLTNANYAFQKYATNAEESARKGERLAITREIHDVVGYTMTTLRMMLEAGKDMIANSPMKLEIQLENALQIVNSGYGEVRDALYLLRGHETEIPAGVPGLKAIIDLFSSTTGVVVSVHWGEIPWHMASPEESALYRFVQEGMSNALSHGNATEIRIAFRREGDTLVASIADNGVGADQIIEGIGISGMKERLDAFGGSVTTQTMRNGFLVTARLPLNGNEVTR